MAAADGGDERAKVALELIGKLYAIERQLPPPLPPSDDPVAKAARQQREEQRCLIRQSLADPVLAELKAWLDSQRSKALPKSPLGQAMSGLDESALQAAKQRVHTISRFCSWTRPKPDVGVSDDALHSLYCRVKSIIEVSACQGSATELPSDTEFPLDTEYLV